MTAGEWSPTAANKKNKSHKTSITLAERKNNGNKERNHD